MSKKIHIYPCVDDMLYAPLYAAIHCLRNRPGVTAHEANHSDDGTIEFPCDQPATESGGMKATEPLSVFLHPRCDGDKAVIDKLSQHKNTASEIHLGVGDPATALARNDHTPFPHLLLSTFVTRVALWAVCRRKGFHARPIDAEKASKRLISGARRADLDLYFRNRGFEPLRLGYCVKGETTTAVVRKFVEQGFDVVPPEHQPSSLGKEEIRGVIQHNYDIVFTYAPWLLPLVVEEERATPAEFSSVPVFHGVPYPFSGVYARFKNEEELLAAGNLVNLFMRQMVAGLTLLYRYKRTAVELLHSSAIDMRHYGMDVRVSLDTRRRMLDSAFRMLIRSDCFSDSIDIPLFSWDLRVPPAEHEALLSAAIATSKLRSPAVIIDERSFITQELHATLRKIVNRCSLEEFGRIAS